MTQTHLKSALSMELVKTLFQEYLKLFFFRRGQCEKSSTTFYFWRALLNWKELYLYSTWKSLSCSRSTTQAIRVCTSSKYILAVKMDGYRNLEFHFIYTICPYIMSSFFGENRKTLMKKITIYLIIKVPSNCFHWSYQSAKSLTAYYFQMALRNILIFIENSSIYIPRNDPAYL